MQFFDIRTSKNCPLLACFVHFHVQMCFSPTRRAIFRHLYFKKCPDTVNFLHFDFKTRFSPQGRAIFRHRKYKKCFGPDVFCTVSLQNALLSTAACSFSTSQEKNASDLTFFVHFDVKMRFSPQGRAIFRHRKYKKCFGPDVFCTVSLQNALLSTAACSFSTSQEKMPRT